MTLWASLPIRYRLSITFGASAAVVVAGLSIFVYAQTGSSLLTAVDAKLNSRAALLVADVRDDGPAQVNVGRAVIESAEVFAQIDDASGRVLRSTALIARSRLLSPSEIRSLHGATLYDRTIPGISNVTRVLAVPVVTPRGRVVVAVGASLQERGGGGGGGAGSSSSPRRSPSQGRQPCCSSPRVPGWHSLARCARSSG
jgi:hypothetical protein